MTLFREKSEFRQFIPKKINYKLFITIFRVFLIKLILLRVIPYNRNMDG